MIRIGQDYTPTEVDLWGTTFETRPVTRSVERAAGELQRKVEESEDADEVVGLLAELLDLRLCPVGHKTRAKTVIEKKWKADELSTPQLTKFCEDLAEADAPPA